MTKNRWNKVHFMPVMSLACNAHCSYCFGPNTGETITTEMLEHVIGFMKKVVNETGQSRVDVTFHGGEPLMAGLPVWKKALSGITRAFPGKNTSFNIQSNLWNLTDDFCRLFKEYKVTIGSSLDGPEAINDRQRGTGYYSNTMRGIKRAETHNLKPGCICTFTPDSVANRKEIFSFFVNNRLPFTIHGSMPSINGHSAVNPISAIAYGQLLCEMLDSYVRYRHYTQISSLDQLIISMAEQEGQVCSFKDCFGMFLAIDPDGDIYPCQRFCGMKAYAIGNVLSNPSLDDLDRHPVARKSIQRQEDVKPKCGQCEHYNYCKGGCTYNAWAAESDIDPYCEAYKMIFAKIKMGLLREMESEENIRAITGETPAGRNQNPLLRKGELIELSRKDSHPMKTAQNAIKIISHVELAAHPSVEKAAEAINRIGLKVTAGYLQKTKESLANSNQRLNNLYLHLTFQCQLNCSHCYATAGRDNRLFMPVEKIIKMTEEASKQGFRQVILTGGEPLLHPELDNLLQQLVKMKQLVSPMHIVLRSNFVARLTVAELELLARAFTKIIVSVDGTREQHDRRRGKGCYDATIQNLEKYQEACKAIPGAAELSLGCVISNRDVRGEQGRSVRELARRLDILNVRFRPVLPIGRARNPDISRAAEAISSFYNTDDILTRELPPVKSCGIGQNLYVEPNGNAFPCYAYQEAHSYLGNVLEDGLKMVLDSEKFRILRKHTVDTNPKCSQCKYRYLCGGACRAWGGEKNQTNLDEPPSECSDLYNQAEEIYTRALNYLASNGLLKNQ
jgi:uncharacterized protein